MIRNYNIYNDCCMQVYILFHYTLHYTLEQKIIIKNYAVYLLIK